MTSTTAVLDSEVRLGPWDLSELLPDASRELLETRLAELESDVTAFEARRGELAPEIGGENFLEILRAFEGLIEKITTLGAYASLRFSADTQSREAQSFRNRVQQVLTEVQNRILFFELWWKALSDDEAAALSPKGSEHADLRHFLRDERRLKPFTLDEKSEQIVNLKDANGLSGVLTLHSMLTNRLEFDIEVDGEKETLTRDALMAYVFSPRAELREAAYRELYRVYEREAAVIGQIYVNRVRDWHSENVGLRGFSTPIAVRNTHNDIPDAAVDVLLDVVRNNRGLFQRYFRLKGAWLGMDKLRRTDVYAPLATSEREVPYPRAVSSVLETFEGFHPRFARHARRVFDDGHIDSEVRPGKRGGAFCSTVSPRLTPWVLVNYTGRVRDVATLAHELGHAVHSMMADGHSTLTQHPSLPLAETASVFSEILMTDRLLGEEKDPLARRELLAAFIDDVYATVLRQTYFTLFEKQAHEAIREGASIDDLNRLYLENLEDQFGDSLEITPEFQYEWLSIPHLFATPFYCYAYSFGQLLVLALYRRYLDQGEAFKPGYLSLLAHGGSARPQEILEEAGIDMGDAAFWQGGFDLVKARIAELETLDA